MKPKNQIYLAPGTVVTGPKTNKKEPAGSESTHTHKDQAPVLFLANRPHPSLQTHLGPTSFWFTVTGLVTLPSAPAEF